MFKDRYDAAQQLAAQLSHYKDDDGVILAIPRGGVPIGYEIAIALGFPLDLALSKKLGHPANPEYAIGSVTLQGREVSEYAKDVPEEFIAQESARIAQELKRKQQMFVGDRPAIAIRGKTVIIVDDGVATGNTIIAAAQGLRASQPAKIVIAIPVAPPEAVENLEEAADEVVCLYTPQRFRSVGEFYDNFEQVDDAEVIAMIREFDRMKKAS